MQAIPISTVSPANAPNLPIAPSQAVGSQSAASPFAAVFQDVLRGAGNPTKFPPPGKAQDSGREPFSKPGTSFSAPLPPVSVPLTLALTPILTSRQNAAPNRSAPATVATAAQTNAPETQALGAPPVALPTLSPIPPLAPFLASFSNSFLPEGRPELARNFAPRGGPEDASATAPLFNATSANFANSASAGSLTEKDFVAVKQNSILTRKLPSSAVANSQNEVQAQLEAQELDALAVAASGIPQEAGGQLAAPAPNSYRGASSASQAIDAPIVGPPSTGNPAPNIETVINVFSVAQLDPRAAQSNDAVAPRLGGTAPAVPAKQALENLVAPFPGLTNAQASVGVSQRSPARPETQQSQLSFQPPAILAASSGKLSSPSTEFLTQAAGKPAATGAPSFLQSHENVQRPGASLTPAPPVPPAPVKGPGQGHSNDSTGNNSNARPEHTSSVSQSKADEKNFVQTLDTAAASSSNGHAAPVDPAPGAPAPPIQAPVAALDLQRAATSSAELPLAAAAPASSHGAPVVSSAHMVDQPGQTEIRIEMQAGSLGGIELRAHIAGGQIGASIAVEHREAQLALATELPALHTALAEKNLRVETLTVTQGTFSSLSGGHGQDPGQRGQGQYPAALICTEQPGSSHRAFNETTAEPLSVGKPANRLSVVA